MQIGSLMLSGSQCFGAEPTTIRLGDLTAFIGADSLGKSTVLQALPRLFGNATLSSHRNTYIPQTLPPFMPKPNILCTHGIGS